MTSIRLVTVRPFLEDILHNEEARQIQFGTPLNVLVVVRENWEIETREATKKLKLHRF